MKEKEGSNVMGEENMEEKYMMEEERKAKTL
jgi:hypothetical protein